MSETLGGAAEASELTQAKREWADPANRIFIIQKLVEWEDLPSNSVDGETRDKLKTMLRDDLGLDVEAVIATFKSLKDPEKRARMVIDLVRLRDTDKDKFDAKVAMISLFTEKPEIILDEVAKYEVTSRPDDAIAESK